MYPTIASQGAAAASADANTQALLLVTAINTALIIALALIVRILWLMYRGR